MAMDKQRRSRSGKDSAQSNNHHCGNNRRPSPKSDALEDKKPLRASGQSNLAREQDIQRKQGDQGAGRKASRTKDSPGAAAATGREHADELRSGDIIVVTIKRLGINGEGVGYYRRKAVFIDGALTHEVVKAEVREIQPKYIKAQLVEVEKRSKDRIEPPCPVFGICGGCQIQHISYEGQLQAKTDIVHEAFSRYAGLDEIRIKPILGMEHPWNYRNKAQLQVKRRGRDVIAGLYQAESHDIVDISGCPIQHPKVNEAVERVKAVLSELDIPLYKEHGGKDGVRTIVVRHGFQSGELQVTLVTDGAKLPRQDDFVRLLRLSMPEVSGIALNINPKKTSLIFGDRTITLWGTEAMQESLSDLEFSLSPRAFFQLNPQQTVKLYESVKGAAALTGKETVIDAYCGTGTIGLWLAPYAKEVRGIETIAEAVEDAKENAARNGRSNVSFHVGAAEELLPRWVKGGLQPDVIIADPPRTGLDRRFLDTVLRTKPKRFVYVSCNPSTLAKDCKVLLDGGYSLEWVQPVDMFPQTSHVEAIVLLQKQ